MVIFFLIAQFLALFVGGVLIDNVSKVQEYQSLNIAPVPAGELSNVVYILGMVLFAALFLLIIFLFPARDLIIRLLEFSATIVSSTIVFFVIFSFFGVPASDLFAFAISLLLYMIRFVYPNIRLVLALIASAGVAAVIGFSLDPFPMIILLIGIAIYDIIAVWWTGHMVTFAKQFVKMKTTFTITATGERAPVKGKELIRGKARFGAIELGTGDLSIPGALCVSAYKFGGLIFPFSAILGAAVGLYLVLEIVEKERRIMPAMPSIGMFSLLFLFAAIIFSYVLGAL